MKLLYLALLSLWKEKFKNKAIPVTDRAGI
jgi:hypothetical protein